MSDSKRAMINPRDNGAVQPARQEKPEIQPAKQEKFGPLAGGPITIEGTFKEVKPAAAAVKAAGRKIGEGHAMAMLRLGGHELTNALAAFPDSNIKPQEEPNVFGNETMPHHVTKSNDEFAAAARRGSGRDNDRSPSP